MALQAFRGRCTNAALRKLACAGAAAVAMLGITLGLAADRSDAHIVDSTGSITHNLFTELSQCVYANGNCSVHSFTFASANDVADFSSDFCADIYKTSYPPTAGNLVKSVCSSGAGIARVCLNNGHGGAGVLHCADQDATMYKAGAYTLQDTTLTRHVIY